MVIVRSLSLVLLSFAVIGMTGCVGPMGAGCCGPMAPGNACTTCNDCTGCGELYIDPWINHPADCVDPCDQCGNHNGQSCGKCRSVFGGVASLWGYRCGCEHTGGIVSLGGCDSCGSGCDPGCGCESCGPAIMEPGCGCAGACTCGVEPACGLEPGCGCVAECTCGAEPVCGLETGYHDGEVIYSGPTVIGESQNSGASNVRVAPAPYRPHREKKIFNPRPSVARGNVPTHSR